MRLSTYRLAGPCIPAVYTSIASRSGIEPAIHAQYTVKMVPDDSTLSPTPSPPVWRFVLGFLAVGICWGFTTPFMRRAAIARDKTPQPARPITSDLNVPWPKRKAWSIIYAVIDLLKNPSYAVPLLLNVTGSVWFFLLIGQAGKLHARL